MKIYCCSCNDDNGNVKAGFVTQVTQSSAIVPSAGAAWWKVGAFTVPGATARNKWTTCTADCYSLGKPTRRRGAMNLGFEEGGAEVGKEDLGMILHGKARPPSVASMLPKWKYQLRALCGSLTETCVVCSAGKYKDSSGIQPCTGTARTISFQS